MSGTVVLDPDGPAPQAFTIRGGANIIRPVCGRRLMLGAVVVAECDLDPGHLLKAIRSGGDPRLHEGPPHRPDATRSDPPSVDQPKPVARVMWSDR